MTNQFSTSPPVTTNRSERHHRAGFMRSASMTHVEYEALPNTYAGAGCGSASTQLNKEGSRNTGEPMLTFMEIDQPLMAGDRTRGPKHARHPVKHLLVDICSLRMTMEAV